MRELEEKGGALTEDGAAEEEGLNEDEDGAGPAKRRRSEEGKVRDKRWRGSLSLSDRNFLR